MMSTARYWMIFCALLLAGCAAALWLRGGTPAGALAGLYSDVMSLCRSVAGTPEERRAATAGAAATASISAAGRPPPVPAFATQRGPDHTREDRQACALPPTRARDDAAEPAIYRWTDENGRLHLSDRAPTHAPASVVDLSPGQRDFTLAITLDGVTLPPNFRGQLHAGSKRMYDAWHFLLGPERLRQSAIDLVLVGDPQRFEQYRGSNLAGNLPISGFYRIADNRAVVKYRADHPAVSLRTSLHEVSHLITASHLGPTPRWLTEGLAEYFENLVARDQGGAIHPNRSHLELLRASGAASLRSLLHPSQPGWNDAGRSWNYAAAWSLVYFLMDSPAGREALRQAVREQHRQFCRRAVATQALAAAYPGGLRALERHWRRWLFSGAARSHRV